MKEMQLLRCNYTKSIKMIIPLHRQHTNYTIIRACHAFTTTSHVQMSRKGFIIYEQHHQIWRSNETQRLNFL